MSLLVLGLICWLVTLILVEGVIFKWLRHQADKLPGKFPELLRCHLCCGVWVGFGIAAITGTRIGSSPVSLLLGGLAIKAVGHIILQVASLLENLSQKFERTPMQARRAAYEEEQYQRALRSDARWQATLGRK